MKKKLESVFEGLLWDSRLIVLSAVVTSLVASLAMFYIATVDAYFMIIHLGEYLSPDLAGEARSAPAQQHHCPRRGNRRWLSVGHGVAHLLSGIV